MKDMLLGLGLFLGVIYLVIALAGTFVAISEAGARRVEMKETRRTLMWIWGWPFFGFLATCEMVRDFIRGLRAVVRRQP